MKIYRTAFLISTLLASITATATVIDTGPGPNSLGGALLVTSNPALPVFSKLAGKFELADSEIITSVEGWINWSQGPSPLTLSIASNVNNLPGSTLYSTTQNIPATSNQPEWLGASDLAWEMDAGTYWLIFSVPANNPAFGVMPTGVANPLPAYAFQTNPYQSFALTSDSYGMRITATSIPESNSRLYIIIGLLAMIAKLATKSNKSP